MQYEADPMILAEYKRIMENESRASNNRSFFLSGGFSKSPRNGVPNLSELEVYQLTQQIAEIAKSSLLPRGYIERYNQNDSKIAFESIAAHTNLVTALVDRALSYYYGPNFGEVDGEWPITLDGWSYRQIMETIRIHDLPENEFGDLPDNGSTNRDKKDMLEHRYLQKFAETYPDSEDVLVHSSLALFRLIGSPRSHTGRLIHLADKAAAIIITLCYDDAKVSPIIHKDDPSLSKRDLEEIKLCDYCENGYFRASEMWTVDYLHIRKFAELDIDGFFTAIIVMYTLMVNGRWYSWREKDYQQNGCPS